MRTMIDFFSTMLLMRAHWLIWIGLLIAANVIAPFFFVGTLEARVVVAAITIAALIMVVIFGSKGFVRLLGLGHIVVWTPLLPWLWTRLDGATAGSAFHTWIVTVIVVDALSLLIDFSDVYRYFNGEKTPLLSLDEGS